MRIDRRGRILCWVVVVSVVQPVLSAAQDDAATPGAADQQPLAGYPIAAARRQAIAAASFHRPLEADLIRRWMQLSSQCTIAEFELFLAPFSPTETALIRKIDQTPAPIVNRLHFGHLRGVLANAAIVGLDLEEESGHKSIPHTTPGIENQLFGGFDCVFASVAPPDGSPRYGDVIIRLNDSVRENGWATPFSGMHFLAAIRGQDAYRMQDLIAAGHTLPTAPTNPLSLGFDDRLHYSHYIVTEQHWNKALAYQAVLVLRNAGDSESGKHIRQRVAALLEEEDADRFWSLFIPARETGLSAAEETARVPFGYLEAKFPGRVAIAEFASIEVPPHKLNAVRTWPEAKPYLELIRAKASGVE